MSRLRIGGAADKFTALFSYSIAGQTLPVVESLGDLGITYDNKLKLKFGLHIDKVCTRPKVSYS